MSTARKELLRAADDATAARTEAFEIARRSRQPGDLRAYRVAARRSALAHAAARATSPAALAP